MPRTKAVAKPSEEEAFLDDLNTKFVYRLISKNEPRGKVYNMEGEKVGEHEYPKRRNLLLKSAILWDGSDCVYEDNDQKKKLISGHKAGKRIIQYYDGCTTLFSEDHPKEKDQMSQLISSTRDLIFDEGDLAVYGYDDMLKKYLDICSWNAASPYRIPTATAIFEPVDIDGISEKESETLDLVEQALDMAREASTKKMLIHARFLGIEEIDYKTSNPLSEKSIRAKYRKFAMDKPRDFIRSFNDKSIQLKAWIEKCMSNGTINTSKIPNEAIWKDTAATICDISGLTSKEGILNKLIEFAKSEDGEEFNEQLTALFN